MTGIADTNYVDMIVQEADGSVVLVMTESREWGSDPLQAEQLKQKVNRYTGYAVEGGLVEDFPHLAEAAVSIRLDCVSSPSGEFARIVELTTAGLGRMGVGFVVNAGKDTASTDVNDAV